MSRLILAASMFTMMLPAVIVDRIAVSAGSRVITESAIEMSIRLAAFQNGTPPDLSPSSRKRAAELLIDQKLVQREMDVGHYPRLNETASKRLVADYAAQYFKSDPAALARALAAVNLSMRDLEAELAWQTELLAFLDLRFRPAVQISEEDLQQKANQNKVSLTQFRERLEKQISAERADADLEVWLKEQRKRTKIEYHDKDLAP